MTASFSNTVERYATALKRYVDMRNEESLVQSFAIGRTGLEGQFNLVDIATTHHLVVEELLGRSSTAAERVQIIESSRDFLLECLGPVEMALRGFRDSNSALQRLNRELEDRVVKRTTNLAEANAKLLQEIDQRRRSETSLAQYTERLRMLRNIDQAVLTADTQAEITDAVLDAVRTLLPSDRITISEYNINDGVTTLVGVWTRFWTRLDKGSRFVIRDIFDRHPYFEQGQPILQRNLALKVGELSSGMQTLFEEGIRSYLSVPLLARGTFIGSINLGRMDPDSFTEKDIEIIREISTQLSVGLDNMRLLETERRRNSELEALHDASLQITAQLELEAVLQTISEYALTVVKANDAQIFLYDGETLTFGASSVDGQTMWQPQTVPKAGGLTEQVARTGERVSIANTDEHPIYEGRGWGGSIISIPLVVGDQVLGVMNLTFEKPYGFTESDLRFLDLLADQAAIALHNAKLYQQLSRYTDDLEQRVDERTRQLRNINEQISAFFRNSADAIVLCDSEGQIYQVNPAYSRLCGIAEPDGDIFSTLKPDAPDALRDAIRQVTLGVETVRTELTLYGMHSAPLNFDVSVVAMPQDESSDSRIIITLHDITNRKRLEEELRNALDRERETRELKSRFTSMVSHEFRTPLAVIQSSSELLARYSERMTEQRRREQLTEIQHQVRNLVGLLEDVLTISRAENVGVDFKPAPLDLVALCRTTMAEIQATTSRHDLQLTTSGDCEEMWGDSKLLQQALRNLLTNAIKYSPAGGAVELRLDCREREVFITVTDHGIGIPEADKKYLFEAFHRAKNVGNISGTGLGLSIVSQAVEVHGGRIEVESTLGIGTSFTLALPRRTG